MSARQLHHFQFLKDHPLKEQVMAAINVTGDDFTVMKARAAIADAIEAEGISKQNAFVYGLATQRDAYAAYVQKLAANDYQPSDDNPAPAVEMTDEMFKERVAAEGYTNGGRTEIDMAAFILSLDDADVTLIKQTFAQAQ